MLKKFCLTEKNTFSFHLLMFRFKNILHLHDPLNILYVQNFVKGRNKSSFKNLVQCRMEKKKKKISATDYTYLELVKCESTLIPRASFVICKTRRSSRLCYTAGVIKSKTLGARNCPIIHPRQALSISLFASQFAQATFIACKLSSRSRLFN